MSDISGIYVITNCINGRKYVGSSNKIEYRFYQHRSELRKNKHRNPSLQAAWNKYGAENFTFSPLEVVDDLSHLLTREKFYMEQLKEFGLYNICLEPSHQRLGVRHTDEAKRKISVGHKGRPQTDEHRNNIKKAMQRPDVQAKLSLGRRGKKRSEESNAKTALSMKKICSNPEHRKRQALKMLEISGTIAWKERARKLGFSNKGRKQKPLNEEQRKRLSESVTEWWKKRKATA